jgi:PAS domain S-box-containing protein
MEKQPDGQDGIWIIGADAKTAYANERMGEILGTSRSEMLGRPSFIYVFPQEVDAAQRLFDAKVRGDTKPFHFKLRQKDGAGCLGRCAGNSDAPRGGRIVGTFSVST